MSAPWLGSTNADPFPLGSGQRALLAGAASGPESVAVSLGGPLRGRALREALAALELRHEALRLRFDVARGLQRIAPAAEPPLRVHDLTVVPPENRRARMEAALVEEVAAPFDLERARPIRFTLLKLAPEHHVLVLTAHPLALDAFSIALLLEEWGELTAGVEPPPASSLVERMAADESAGGRERAAADSQALARALGAPPAPLPIARTGGRARALSRLVPAAPVRAALREGSARGATPFATLAATFGLLLHRLSRREDLLVGAVVPGRALPAERRLAGPFTRVLPFRSRLAPGIVFSDHLRETRRALALLNERQAAACVPGLAVGFAHENGTGQPRLPGLTVAVRRTPPPTVPFGLALYVRAVETDDGMLVTCDASPSIPVAFVARGLALAEPLLATLAADPLAAVARLPLLAPPERRHAPGPQVLR